MKEGRYSDAYNAGIAVAIDVNVAKLQFYLSRCEKSDKCIIKASKHAHQIDMLIKRYSYSLSYGSLVGISDAKLDTVEQRAIVLGQLNLYLQYDHLH